VTAFWYGCSAGAGGGYQACGAVVVECGDCGGWRVGKQLGGGLLAILFAEAAGDQADLGVQSEVENDEPVHFVVDVAALQEPPAGVDDDVEIVLEGDRCPPSAG
jgi:hypothetical protein